MENWKRALLAGSAGTSAVMFLKGNRAAGFILAGVSLATLASEYPEKFAEFREISRATSNANAISDAHLAPESVSAELRKSEIWPGLESLLETQLFDPELLPGVGASGAPASMAESKPR